MVAIERGIAKRVQGVLLEAEVMGEYFLLRMCIVTRVEFKLQRFVIIVGLVFNLLLNVPKRPLRRREIGPALDDSRCQLTVQ